MEKKHYALKLIPKRPIFPGDMTPEERTIMEHHVAYWKELMDKGKVIVFGPVMDPKGVYGFGIIEVDSEEQVHTFIADDPAGVINDYEYYPMRAIVRGE